MEVLLSSKDLSNRIEHYFHLPHPFALQSKNATVPEVQIKPKAGHSAEKWAAAELHPKLANGRRMQLYFSGGWITDGVVGGSVSSFRAGEFSKFWKVPDAEIETRILSCLQMLLMVRIQQKRRPSDCTFMANYLFARLHVCKRNS